MILVSDVIGEKIRIKRRDFGYVVRDSFYPEDRALGYDKMREGRVYKHKFRKVLRQSMDSNYPIKGKMLRGMRDRMTAQRVVSELKALGF